MIIPPETVHRIAPFGLNTKHLDRVLSARLGINLEELGELSPGTLEELRRITPVYTNKRGFRLEVLEDLLGLYPQIREPNALHVETQEELIEHMLRVHETCFGQAVLAKHTKMRGGSFPKGCCVESARNATLSLMRRGYSSAIYGKYVGEQKYYATTRAVRHSFGAIPFVLGETSGVIFYDPSAGQVWYNDMVSVVELKLGSRWEYVRPLKTFAGGRMTIERRDMFPTRLLHIGDIQTIYEWSVAERKLRGNLLSREYERPEDVFESAFRSPIPYNGTGHPAPRRQIA